MAAAASGADAQVRELHQKFADQLLSAVPDLSPENYSKEEYSRLSEEAVQKMLSSLDDDDREELQQLLARKVEADKEGWTKDDKKAVAITVGCGALGVGAAWLSEKFHHWNMADIAKARVDGSNMLKEAHRTGNMDLAHQAKAVLQGGEGVTGAKLGDLKDLDPTDPKWKNGLGNDSHSKTTDNEFKAAGIADYVALAGGLAQLAFAQHALWQSYELKSEIMKECGDASDSAEEKADVTTWRGRLKKQQDKLGVLQREYKLFLDQDVVDLGKGGNLDADGLTPVYQRYNDFVMRAQSVVITVMNLHSEIQVKNAKLATQLNTCFTMAAGTGVQTVVSFAQAIARPNPITIINVAVLGAACQRSTQAYYVAKDAKAILTAMECEVEETLRQAQFFLAKMHLGRELAQKGMDEYKELKTELKSKLQLELDESQRKEEEASRAAAAAAAEIAELKRMLAAAKGADARLAGGA